VPVGCYCSNAALIIGGSEDEAPREIKKKKKNGNKDPKHKTKKKKKKKPKKKMGSRGRCVSYAFKQEFGALHLGQMFARAATGIRGGGKGEGGPRRKQGLSAEKKSTMGIFGRANQECEIKKKKNQENG